MKTNIKQQLNIYTIQLLIISYSENTGGRKYW